MFLEHPTPSTPPTARRGERDKLAGFVASGQTRRGLSRLSQWMSREGTVRAGC